MLQQKILLSLLFIAVGVLLIATVYDRVEHLRHLRRGVNDSPISGQWQALRGSIHAEDGVLTAPVSGRPAVALDYEIKRRKKRRRSRRRSGRRYRWVTVADEEEFTPFVIETDDGLIDTGNNPNFRYAAGRTETMKIKHTGLLGSDDTPDAMQRFLQRREGLEAEGRRQYVEKAIVDGDDVVVYGYYEETPEGSVVRGSGDFPVVGMNESDILATIAKPLAVRGIAGSVLILMGLGTLFL